MDMSFSKLIERVKDREACCAAVHGITKSDMTDRLNKVTIYRYTHTYTHTHTHTHRAYSLCYIAETDTAV